ncbi:hypothetical protein ABIA31_005782 [Catenulispora sp. MAP5-51]|uniref:hypothetical protein n=1 Tax=Catenulispora sp. MAP5-51 TaxID=3156298 RepID=UPI003514ADB0
MSQAAHVEYTHLLRTSSFDLWQRLRVLLGEQGLDPATTVVVDLFPDGGDREFGQVISEDGRVYRFDLCYDRGRPQSVRNAALERWTDITESWQTEPLRNQTADAFTWAPPPIRTRLTAQAANDHPRPTVSPAAPSAT